MSNEDLILRDHLAIDRTKLANQRTLLSFIRTSLYLTVSGLAVMNVEVLKGISFLGWILIGISLLAMLAGFINYFVFRKKIFKAYHG